jgi:hypothetical protein
MRGKRWSEETKAAAMADLAAGMKVKDVAEKYGMPHSTAGALSPSSKPGALKIQKMLDLQDVADLFSDHTRLNFAAQEAILRKFTDAKWLDRQPATELIGAYATLFAKGGKLLGAQFGPPAAAVGSDDDHDQDAA